MVITAGTEKVRSRSEFCVLEHCAKYDDSTMKHHFMSHVKQWDEMQYLRRGTHQHRSKRPSATLNGNCPPFMASGALAKRSRANIKRVLAACSCEADKLRLSLSATIACEFF